MAFRRVGISKLKLAGMAAAALVFTGQALAAPATTAPSPRMAALLPADLGPYRDILTRIDGQSWTDAKTAILALDATDPMRSYLLANLYLTKGSPRVELFDLLDLLAKAPYLPQTDQLSRLAEKRGAQLLPSRPEIRQLMYVGGSPQRAILSPIKGDMIASALAPRIAEYIKADNPAGAEAMLDTSGTGISPACLTEQRQRIAWSFYITNDFANAQRLAAKAVAEGQGPYMAPSHWVAGLSLWRQHDWAGAAAAFSNVARTSADADLRSAGYYWAARASMAAGRPQQVSALLNAAAREEETFYGLLASDTLGLKPSRRLVREQDVAPDWQAIAALPGVRIAAALAALGRTVEADDVLRNQAVQSGPERFAGFIHVASALSLPRAQLWLAQRSPDGVKAQPYMRYPMPDWTPAGGWRVDRALVFAHALQESRFQTDAQSSAGARGLMQVLPSTANLMAAAAGEQIATADLGNPSINMEYGQRYLEKLSGMSATDGLLAKVVAAYNAGPGVVERWKYQVRDEGDPLLFIESVPYYETRAYVNVVLRNYWMYQMEQTGRSSALTALAQGLWSRFPGKSGEMAVRMTAAGRAFGAD